MIRVTFIKNSSDELCGFRMKGHAGFARAGQDIVCAGVSALVTNTINSIGAFTKDKFVDDVQEQEKDVVFFAISTVPVSKESALLLKSLSLGLHGIQDCYGKKFIQIDISDEKQEV